MSRKPKPLRTFVYRVLALRLLLASLLIGLLFGAMVYFGMVNEISRDIIEDALNRIDDVRSRSRELLAQGADNELDAFRAALSERPKVQRRQRYGRFVHGIFHDAAGSVLGAFTAPDSLHEGEVRDWIRSSKRRFPEPGDPWHEPVRVAGTPHIHMVTAVTDEKGNVPGYADILFALSPEAAARVRRSARNTALYVVLITLGAALFLYPVILNLTRRLAGYSENLLQSNLETLSVLGGAIAKRDNDTDAHNMRVTIFAVRLAEAAGLPDTEMKKLIKGAFLHDVGKIGIRDDILLKPDRLNDDETRIMQTHVRHGLEIVQRSAWLDDAASVVGGHHEQFGGGGYPKRLQGEEIPIIARIFSLADVFDALTSRRPYKEAFSLDKTLEILEQGRGAQFDPALLDVFIPLAPDLYERFSGREDAGLREALDTITLRYFTGGMESLTYG